MPSSPGMTISYFCPYAKRKRGGGPRLNIIMMLILGWKCPSLRERPTQHSVTPFSTRSRQLRQQISGVQQQQDLVASRWCKNLAARCFNEGTENDVRKYMIHSRLSNVSDSRFKLFKRKRELTLELLFSAVRSNRLSLRFRSIDYLRGLFLPI